MLCESALYYYVQYILILQNKQFGIFVDIHGGHVIVLITLLQSKYQLT